VSFPHRFKGFPFSHRVGRGTRERKTQSLGKPPRARARACDEELQSRKKSSEESG
jgi:hypothetical protein